MNTTNIKNFIATGKKATQGRWVKDHSECCSSLHGYIDAIGSDGHTIASVVKYNLQDLIPEEEQANGAFIAAAANARDDIEQMYVDYKNLREALERSEAYTGALSS